MSQHPINEILCYKKDGINLEPDLNSRHKILDEVLEASGIYFKANKMRFINDAMEMYAMYRVEQFKNRLNANSIPLEPIARDMFEAGYIRGAEEQGTDGQLGFKIDSPDIDTYIQTHKIELP